MGLSKVSTELDNAEVDCQPRGDYVRPETVARIDDLLDPGEPVHYVLVATAVEVDGERDLLTDGPVRVAATGGRVVLKVPRLDGVEDYSVPYEAITNVRLDAELVKNRVAVETGERSLSVAVREPATGECREAVEFVREQARP